MKPINSGLSPIVVLLYSSADAVIAWNEGNSGELTSEELSQYGFFRKFSHFKDEENGYSYLYGAINTAVVFKEKSHQWDLLASAIPAMSFAANPMEILPETRNFDMEAMREDKSLWPDVRKDSEKMNTRWLHSDIRNMDLPYVHNTFDEMLKLGGFNW